MNKGKQSTPYLGPKSALRARLNRIPEGSEQEIADTRLRYADPTHRTFPVAVEFVVPETLNKGH